jgi:hypothetical protein
LDDGEMCIISRSSLAVVVVVVAAVELALSRWSPERLRFLNLE